VLWGQATQTPLRFMLYSVSEQGWQALAPVLSVVTRWVPAGQRAGTAGVEHIQHSTQPGTQTGVACQSVTSRSCSRAAAEIQPVCAAAGSSIGQHVICRNLLAAYGKGTHPAVHGVLRLLLMLLPVSWPLTALLFRAAWLHTLRACHAGRNSLIAGGCLVGANRTCHAPLSTCGKPHGMH
jgi:hypothetical protein